MEVRANRQFQLWANGRSEPIAIDRDCSNQRLVFESADLPDLLDWERRPGTKMVPEKTVIASPYVGGSKDRPRDIRTLRRWRTGRRGPSFLEIGGRYFYTVQALRDFYHRGVRGGYS